MPLLKPSKTVSRRIKRSTPLSFHPSDPPALALALALAPASFPFPKSICSSASAAAPPPKERVLRVICTDPDATDSSSDEEEEEEEEDRQGGVEDEAAQAEEEEEEEEEGGMIPPHLPNNRKRRLVREVCLPAASASASPNTIDMASRYDNADDDGNRHAKKLSRREQHQQEALDCGAFQSCGSCIHSTGDQDDEFCGLFPSELFALPDGAGDSVDGESWGVGWVLPEDDSLFNDAGLHLDYPITTAWFDSLHSLPS